MTLGKKQQQIINALKDLKLKIVSKKIHMAYGTIPYIKIKNSQGYPFLINMETGEYYHP